jgi:hypothetical protein
MSSMHIRLSPLVGLLTLTHVPPKVFVATGSDPSVGMASFNDDIFEYLSFELD